jgi:hypothetical protein
VHARSLLITTSRKSCRTWIGLCTTLLLIGVIAAYFGPQVVRYLELLPRLRQTSIPVGWNSTPRPLADTTASMGDGSTISYYGYKFEVPWKDIVEERNPAEWVETEFKDGQTVKFINPAYFREGPVNDDSQSRYEQYKAMLGMTPSQLSPFCSRREFARALTLLDAKGFLFEHNPVAPDILSFETHDYRGFEFSELSQGRQSARLTFFDAADHSFHLTISITRSATTKLTQSEINRIVQSFGPSRSKPSNDKPSEVFVPRWHA